MILLIGYRVARVERSFKVMYQVLLWLDCRPQSYVSHFEVAIFKHTTLNEERS